MRAQLAAFSFAVATLVSGPGRADEAVQIDAQVKATITDLENRSWVAWKARDGNYFEQFTSGDHLDVGAGGPMDRDAVVSGVSSPACAVASYSVGPMRFVRLTADSAMLIYRAEQDTTCGGKPVPSPSWVTSVYVYRDGRWQNALFEDLPAAH